MKKILLIIDFSKNNIDKYESFHIITGDKDFYKLIKLTKDEIKFI